MSTTELDYNRWRKILRFLRKRSDVYVGKPRECKRFIDAVLWMMRSGAQWRLLPEEYGNWNSIYKRFNRWSEKGVWQAMFEHFADDPDMQSVMIDGSVVRAHVSAAGAAKKGGRMSRHSGTAEVASAVNFMSQSML